jgi:septum formation protein
MEIILASASPRRKELLKKILKEFKVIPTNIDENITVNKEEPSKIAEILAFKKAQEIARKHPKSLVIGADTIVEREGIIYGKPQDDGEAVKVFKELRGTTQKVITGIAILCKEKNISLVDSEVTHVKMRDDISNKEIEDYVKTGEGKDKAGGYAAQEKGDKFIEWIKGDYYNVVGFPLNKVYTMLQKTKDRWNLEIDLIYNEQKQDEFIC